MITCIALFIRATPPVTLARQSNRRFVKGQLAVLVELVDRYGIGTVCLISFRLDRSRHCLLALAYVECSLRCCFRVIDLYLAIRYHFVKF